MQIEIGTKIIQIPKDQEEKLIELIREILIDGKINFEIYENR